MLFCGYRVIVLSRNESWWKLFALDILVLPFLFGVVDNLGVHIFGYLASEAHSHANDVLSNKIRQTSKDLIWAEMC
jgi:hypothetical protein